MRISFQVMNVDYASVGQGESLWIIYQYSDTSPLHSLDKSYLPALLSPKTTFAEFIFGTLITPCKTEN